jgi:type II secretory ATPase GspE/PulE/Tfp pilus assembly ATPase PilB-like protein
MSDAAFPRVFSRVSLADFRPLPDGSQQYPIEYIEGNSVIRLREEDDVVHVGLVDPGNSSLMENLTQFHAKKILFYQIEKSELAGYLSERLASAGSDARAHQAYASEKVLLDRLANDAPIVNLVNSILIEAIRLGASDIHIECCAEQMIVRYRLDGFLQTVNHFEKAKFPGVSSRIKIMANLNIMERRLPQDGRITVHLGDDARDLRVSIVPVTDGESIVLRLFNRKGALLSIEQLGLQEDDLGLLQQIVRQPNGLFLITGPTGSGKTTTLSAVLQFIKSDATKIISIEDPIEYLIEGINQIQTNDAIGLTFESLLRRVLRQDPNIIMVGEIRDSPTADLAIRAALTGHLVLSTLHTKDALAVIPRLQNLGVEPYLLSAVLRGSAAQRLVRKICPECRTAGRPSTRDRELLHAHGIEAGTVYHGKGCRSCRQTGYRGRTAIFELFTVDRDMEEMIRSGSRPADLSAHLARRGFRTIIADGLAKAVKGTTSFSEVARAVAG